MDFSYFYSCVCCFKTVLVPAGCLVRFDVASLLVEEEDGVCVRFLVVGLDGPFCHRKLIEEKAIPHLQHVML